MNVLIIESFSIYAFLVML